MLNAGAAVVGTGTETGTGIAMNEKGIVGPLAGTAAGTETGTGTLEGRFVL